MAVCVSNGAEVAVTLNPCRMCKARNQVIQISVGQKHFGTAIVECIVCQNSTMVLPSAVVALRWNQENPIAKN